MSTIDIGSLLPDPNKENYEKLKREHPFNILTQYAQAIGKKYPGKLDGIITESTDLSGTGLINYAFYILAAIGKGYSYRLLEVVPATAEMYPLRATFLKGIHRICKKLTTTKSLKPYLMMFLEWGLLRHC